MRIILICYEKLFSEIIETRLRMAGFDLLLIRDELEERSFCYERSDDLILMVVPNVFSSYPIAVRLLREHYKVFLISAIHDDKVVMRAYALGAKGYMSLPICIDRLIHKIASLV